MIGQLKKSWAWLIGCGVLALAVVVWVVSGKRSSWAAQKILALQEDTEQKAERIADKAAKEQRQLDNTWRKKRKAIKEAEIQKLQTLREEAKRLDAAVLKRKLMEDLDEPL